MTDAPHAKLITSHRSRRPHALITLTEADLDLIKLGLDMIADDARERIADDHDLPINREAAKRDSDRCERMIAFLDDLLPDLD